MGLAEPDCLPSKITVIGFQIGIEKTIEAHISRRGKPIAETMGTSGALFYFEVGRSKFLLGDAPAAQRGKTT